MSKYFIEFENYVSVNKKISFETKLYVKRKTKSGLYRFESIIFYNDERFIKTIKNNKNIVIELKEDELEEYNDLLIKKYNLIDGNIYKEQIYNNKPIKLINYNALIDMNEEEISKGYIIFLEVNNEDRKYYNINFNINSLFGKENIKNIRKKLISENLASDIYFYTEEDELLEKYDEYTVEIKEELPNKYKVLNNKYYILDSLKNSDIIGFNSSNYLLLDTISDNSIPVYIVNKENNFDIVLNNINYGKKGYCITNPDIEKLLKKEEIKPLLKYINLYKLESDSYKKTPIINIEEEKNILKYQRINKRK